MAMASLQERLAGDAMAGIDVNQAYRAAELRCIKVAAPA
jgi:hypothetical protein